MSRLRRYGGPVSVVPSSGPPPGTARRRGRPPKGEPVLTRERIGRAVLDEVSAHGADRVTMRSLAARLDVTPRAVYKVVRDRDDALAAAVVVAQRDWPSPRLDPAHAEADLTTFCHQLRTWYRRHPVLLRIVASTPMDDEVRAAAMRNMDVLAGFLLGTGLTPADAARACDLIIGTVSGFAELEEWEARAGAADPRHAPAEDTPAMAAFTAGSADELPHLRRIAPAAASDVDDRFADRVEMLLLWLRSRLP